LDSFVTCHPVLSYSDPAQRTQLEALFRQAHLFFMPSRAEAYGLVYCEANAFGLPCIATATGGAAHIIREGINGYTLPPEADAAAYAEIIRRAIDSEEHYQRLAMNAYEEFRQRLNWDTFCREFLQLLEERVLQQSERRSPVGSSLALS
jgi:glycosyltransferase involved in cell wall biosynthesis